jgi:hypothetical protein
MPLHATYPLTTLQTLTRPPPSIFVWCTNARSRTRVPLTVTPALRIRLREYLFNTKHLRATGKAQEVMSLMSDTLRGEVGLHINDAPVEPPLEAPLLTPLVPPLVPHPLFACFSGGFHGQRAVAEGRPFPGRRA